MIKTTDGGQNWITKYQDDLGSGHFYDIQFLNKNVGFAVGKKLSTVSKSILLRTIGRWRNMARCSPTKFEYVNAYFNSR